MPALLADRALNYWLASYRRTWRGSVVTGFASPLLYLTALGFGLGSLVDRGGPGRLAGVAYAVFVAPGVLAANAMQTAVAETTYPVMGAIRWHRQYFAMLATPLGVLDVLLGHLAFVVLRIGLVTAAFLLIGGLLGAFGSWWAVLAGLVAVLGGLAHATPVMAFAARVESDNSFNFVFRFGVVPMFLFAGTFFPVEQLPVALRPVAWVTPLWHATSACRDLALGRPDLLVDLGHIGYLAAWAGVGLWLAVRAFRWRLLR
jgi:lipooligosaccharide transport system permease protein